MQRFYPLVVPDPQAHCPLVRMWWITNLSKKLSELSFCVNWVFVFAFNSEKYILKKQQCKSRSYKYKSLLYFEIMKEKKIRFQREWRRGIIQKTNQTHGWRTERGSCGLESVHGHDIPWTSGALFGILQSSHVIAKLFAGARNREPLGSTCVEMV